MYAAKYLQDIPQDAPTSAQEARYGLERIPLNQPIEILTARSTIWRRVKWYAEGVTLVRGIPTLTGIWESRERESFYIDPIEVIAWRQIAWPDD